MEFLLFKGFLHSASAPVGMTQNALTKKTELTVIPSAAEESI